MLSKNYKNWIATIDLRICGKCFNNHGQVYEFNDWIEPEPPLHPKCRCVIEALKSRLAGTATTMGNDGADWWLKQTGDLPDYYITLNKFLITDKDIMNTAVHELLHTVKGGMTHGGEWKKWKLFVNKNSEFKVTILSKIKLDSGAYKNKKVFLEGDFNPQTMELLQCPKCFRKIAVKKGTCKTKDGKCKYFCSTCKKRFEYV